MKRKTLEKIIGGEKKTIRVDGYKYAIEIDRDYKEVNLFLNGWMNVIASSSTSKLSYPYTHGNFRYQDAVDIAHEIASVLPEDTDE